MATVSIEEKVVIIKNKKKIQEIKTALNSKTRAFIDVKPAIEDTKAKELINKWSCR